MTGGHTVIMANYHRIGERDPDNPLHRLHTVSTEIFRAQVDYMQHHGKVVSLDDVRSARDLADTNYVISFDDVPVSAVPAINLLLQRGLPVTVAVCAQLATHGWGTRDKVYAIEKYTDPVELDTAMGAWLLQSGTTVVDPGSFYQFTKRDDLDPGLVTSGLINPLFAAVEPQARSFLEASPYLGWDEVTRLAHEPLVTWANHGLSHANLAAVPRARLIHDITRGHELLSQYLGFAPRYFAVPFGRYAQQLALDCVDILDRLDYHGLLWVGHAGTHILGPYTSQLLQVTRMHAPTTLDDFIAAAADQRRASVQAAVWQLPSKPTSAPLTIAESSDQKRAGRFEMIVRQGKDYASDPAFYRHQFSTNPAKGDRPDHYTAEARGQIHAIAYNFHSHFSFAGTRVPGVYLAGWRKLPQTHPAGAGRLIQRMIAREAIVGVYRPSPQAASAFATWKRVPVCRLEIPVSDQALNPHARWIRHFESALTPLCVALTAKAGFTVARTENYYRWRHERYPLASCHYVLLMNRGRPRAYAVVHRRGNKISMADMYAATEADHCDLIASVLRFAHAHGDQNLAIETSDLPVAAAVRRQFGGTATHFANYYHLNPSRLASLGVLGADQQWADFRFHESATTGDVLIR